MRRDSVTSGMPGSVSHDFMLASKPWNRAGSVLVKDASRSGSPGLVYLHHATAATRGTHESKGCGGVGSEARWCSQRAPPSSSQQPRHATAGHGGRGVPSWRRTRGHAGGSSGRRTSCPGQDACLHTQLHVCFLNARNPRAEVSLVDAAPLITAAAARHGKARQTITWCVGPCITEMRQRQHHKVGVLNILLMAAPFS